LKEWTTRDSQNTPSTTNLEEEEIVDDPVNDGNASMPELVKRPNPWRKMMMMMMILINLNFLNKFSRNIQISSFMKIHLVGAKVHAYGWTDRQTDR